MILPGIETPNLEPPEEHFEPDEEFDEGEMDFDYDADDEPSLDELEDEDTI